MVLAQAKLMIPLTLKICFTFAWILESTSGHHSDGP